MQFLITGGTGFIGRGLVTRLLQDGHGVTVVSRQDTKSVQGLFPAGIKTVSAITAVNPALFFDTVINLAGEGILDKRWGAVRKQQLLSSRVDITAELIDLMERMENRPRQFISGSAVGFYGSQSSAESLDEGAEPGKGFAANLCEQWERVALRAKILGVSTSIVRTGVVLHPDGGALQRMLSPFRFGLGGPVGNGRQMMSWIHRQDMINLLLFMVNTPEIEGVFNATAPSPVSNKEFATVLSRTLHRPSLFSMPSSVLNFLLGESAMLLTEGQAVLPVAIEKAGFKFSYPTLEEALEQLLNGD